MDSDTSDYERHRKCFHCYSLIKIRRKKGKQAQFKRRLQTKNEREQSKNQNQDVNRNVKWFQATWRGEAGHCQGVAWKDVVVLRLHKSWYQRQCWRPGWPCPNKCSKVDNFPIKECQIKSTEYTTMATMVKPCLNSLVVAFKRLQSERLHSSCTFFCSAHYPLRCTLFIT